MEEKTNNAFTLGFVLGMFFGVGGYYLFGTDQGKETKARLAEEWDKAYQHLVDEGVLDEKPAYKKLGDLVNSAKETFKKRLNLEEEPTGGKQKRVTRRKKRTYKRKSKIQQKQFKGV